MTTPQAPAAAPVSSPAPSAPAPQQEPGQGEGQGQGQEPAATPELENAYREERRKRIALEQQLGALQQQSMTDAERAVAQAREEGRREAEAAAARLLAAAELRHLLAGRVPDPEATVEALNLDLFVRDGQPNKRAITSWVDKMPAAPAAPPQQFGHVPAGSRQTAPPEGQDWLGATIRGGGR